MRQGLLPRKYLEAGHKIFVSGHPQVHNQFMASEPAVDMQKLRSITSGAVARAAAARRRYLVLQLAHLVHDTPLFNLRRDRRQACSGHLKGLSCVCAGRQRLRGLPVAPQSRQPGVLTRCAPVWLQACSFTGAKYAYRPDAVFRGANYSD